MTPSLRARLQLNTRLLPPLVVLLAVLQLFVPFPGWMMALVTLGGLWLMAYLWARVLARNLRLLREVRFGWAQVGDRFEERFTLSNSGWVPALWVEIRDHSTFPDYAASRATGVGGNEENSWTTDNVCSRRGAFRIGPTTVLTGDPFGLYTVSIDFAASTTMLVMPPVVPLPRIQIAPGGRTGEGNRRIETWEQTVTVSSVRDYFPGDSPRTIHWPTTAHRDALSIRLFDSTPTSNWWIVLDLNKAVQVGEGKDSTLEHGVILAASLTAQGLRTGRAVGLLAHGNPTILGLDKIEGLAHSSGAVDPAHSSGTSGLAWLPPRQGESQQWLVLRELALVAGGRHSLQDLLEGAKSIFAARSSLILITADTRGEWVQALGPFLRRGIVPTVLLFDPVSFGGSADTKGIVALLAQMEIAHHVLTRDVLDRPEARPGHQGYWEWRVTPHGKALARSGPRDTRWRELA